MVRPIRLHIVSYLSCEAVEKRSEPANDHDDFS
jgi:hypothetical protein